MTTVDLSRAQFAATTVYHFLFVPVTIGLAFFVAILQTIWHRSGDAEMRRLTRFFGTLLLINVAIGVVTGLVQEFEFGMNWSAYSRFVGDVFGGPLAMEGLAAFFLESTFLGLWVFGWDRLPKRVHLACIWVVAAGTVLSAGFIMAANSWMQHPVGYTINSKTGRAELNNIGALFTNPVFLWGFAHVLLASAVTGALIMLARVGLAPAQSQVGGRLRPNGQGLAGGAGARHHPGPVRGQRARGGRGQVPAHEDRRRRGPVGQLPALLVLAVPGRRGQRRRDARPRSSRSPTCCSLLATNHWNGAVEGLNEVNAQYQKEYGPGDYVPNVFIQYWSMRVMAYLAALVLLLALWGAWAIWRRRLERSRWFLLGRHLGRHRPLLHEHRRLAADRERAPALDRPGPHADQGRGVHA